MMKLNKGGGMIQYLEIMINPVAKPRQTQRDKWAKRPCVMRYRAFADQLRASGLTLPECGYHLIFVLPMPPSWTDKKRVKMNGKPHQQVPDKDNLEKAVLDALFENDCRVWDGRVSKFWGVRGKLIVKEIEKPELRDQNAGDSENEGCV